MQNFKKLIKGLTWYDSAPEPDIILQFDLNKMYKPPRWGCGRLDIGDLQCLKQNPRIKEFSKIFVHDGDRYQGEGRSKDSLVLHAIRADESSEWFLVELGPSWQLHSLNGTFDYIEYLFNLYYGQLQV